MKDVKDEFKGELRQAVKIGYRRIDIEAIEFMKFMAQDAGVKLFMPDVMELDCEEFTKLYDRLYIEYFMKHFGPVLYSDGDEVI